MSKLRLSNKEEMHLNQMLLAAIPHPAMLIRCIDRVVLAANKVALDLGVVVGEQCWRVFGKSEYLSKDAKELAKNYPGLTPTELGIKCTFCLADNCFSSFPTQNNPEIQAFGKVWDTYWIKITDEIYLHYAIDITDHKQREAELKLKNIILSTQLDTSLEGILVVDENGKIISYNPRFLELWGISEEVIASGSDEEVLQSVINIIEDPTEFLKRVKYLYSHKDESSYEVIKLKDGRSFERYSAPMLEQDRKYHGRVWYFTDATERKRAETVLLDNQEKYKMLFENAGDAIFIHNYEARILSANQMACERLGYTRAELLKMTINQIDTDQEAIHIQDRIKEITELGKLSFETVHQCKDKSQIYTEVNARTINWEGKPAVISICRDITVRKKAEEMIRDIALFPLENPNPILRINSKGELLFSNESAKQNFECWQLTLDNPAPKLLCDAVKNVLKDNTPVEFIHRLKDKDWSFYIIPIKKSGYANIYAIDISDRKRVEDELALSKQRLELAQKSAGAGAWDWDMNTQKLEWSNEMFTMFGLDPNIDEASFETWNRVVHPDDLERATLGIKKSIEQKSQLSQDYRVLHPNGKVHWIDAFGNTTYDDSGNPIRMAGICIDNTERKLAQEQLLKSQLLLKSSIESPKDIIILSIDNNYRYLYFNSFHKNVMKRSYGSDIELGMNLIDCISNDNDKHKAKTNYNRALKGESHTTIEEYGTLERYFYETRYNPIYNDKDKIIGATAFSSNITDRIRTEIALKKSEEELKVINAQLRDAQHIAKIGSWTHYLDEPLPVWSEEMYMIFGLDPQNGVPEYEAFRELIHPDQRLILDDAIKKVLTTGEGYSLDVLITTSEGRNRTIHMQCTSSDSEDENKPYILGTAQDITDRKKAEDAIRENEIRYRELFNNTGSGVAIYNVIDGGKDFIFKDLNKKGEQITGNRREDVIGKSIYKVHEGVDNFGLINVFHQVLQTGNPEFYPAKVYKDDKLNSWFENFVYLLPTGEIVAVFDDFTDRETAIQALRESEERFRGIIENSKAGYFFIDNDGYYRDVNEAWLKLHKFDSKDEIIGHHFSETQIDKEKKAAKYIVDTTLNNEEVSQGEFSRLCKDGSIGWHTFSINPVLKDSVIIGMEGFLIDITERKLTEEAFKASENRYRRLFEAAQDGILIIDADSGKIIDVNQCMQDMLGYAYQDFIGKQIWEIGPFQDINVNLTHSEELINTGYVRYDDIPLVTKHGKLVNVEFISNVYLVDNVKVLQCNIRNITERKQAEEALRANEIKFHNLLHSIPGIVYICENDSNWTMLYINQEIDPVSLYPTSDFINNSVRSYASIIHPDDKDIVELDVQQGVNNKTFYSSEYRIRNADGEYRWVYDRGQGVFDEDGHLLWLNGVISDISERKLAEKAFIASEMRYRRLFESAKDGILILDANTGMIVDVNPFLIELLGITFDEIYGKFIWELSPFQDIFSSLIALETLQSKEYIRYEHLPLKASSGKTIDVEFISNVYLVNEVKVIQCNIRDISDRKRAQDALKESEEKNRLLITQMQQGLAVHEIIVDETSKPIDYRFIDANESFERIIGLKREEFIGKTVLEVLPDIENYWIEKHGKVALTGEPLVYENYSKSLDKYFETVTYSPKPYQFAVVISDITDRKRAENALLESEKKFSSAFQTSPYTIIISRIEDGQIIEVNNAFFHMTGYTLEEALNSSTLSLNLWVYYEDRKNVITALKKGQDVLSKEYLFRTKNGKIITGQFSAKLIKIGDDLCILSSINDITDQKIAEAKILENQKLLSKTEEIAQFGSWELNNITSQLHWSDEIYRLFGYQPQEFQATYDRFLKAIHPDDREKVNEKYIESIITGKDGYELEHRIIQNNSGEIIYVYEKCEHQRDKSGKITKSTGYIQDITARKIAEASLLEKERLSAIGELASGIAHDFNNSLQAIIGNIELALMTSDIPEEIVGYLKTIQSTSDDATARVRQLQRFARQEKETGYKPVDIITLIEETIEQTRPKWKDETEKKGLKITFRKDYGSVGLINGNIGELRSAFYNLIINAIEAMPKGGYITIQTGDLGNEVFIRITDTGLGMDDDTAKRIFQPFFTTKGYELGRGLGLSAVYSTVRDHGGNIFVKETALGVGTTIELTLQRSINIAIPNQPLLKEQPINSVSLDILWVDDNKDIRNLGEKLLTVLGHRVNVAESGSVAIKLLSEKDFDLLITDIGMPGMSGWQLAETIKNRYKNLKVAIVSGWGTNFSEEEKERCGVNFIIGKPIHKEELRKLIEEVNKVSTLINKSTE